MSVDRRLDPELLAGFHQEVDGYLPVISQGLAAFSRLGDPDSLVEPHRLVHTIKGTASLLGLTELTETAGQG
ncbi:MAG TPA: Hpt domain-containing protein, partial [Thermoanaerobaculia bacterium]|nr:Hpt domain-containing protein [Thermoanaerobaculia bacterium]